MKVLVVSRTRMQSRHCVGALLGDGTSIRLLEADGSNQSPNSPFQIGQIWDIDYLRTEVTPPHVEDVIVTRRGARPNRVIPDDQLASRINKMVYPWRGSISLLFDEKVSFTGNNNGYVCERLGIPSRSTWFWLPDRNLQLRCDGKHYDYLGRGMAYVGVLPRDEDLPKVLPAGTLVRVSLARWWRPEDSDSEMRCYLQMSGWYCTSSSRELARNH